MKIAIYTALALSIPAFASPKPLVGKPWRELAIPVPIFADREIEALALAGETLYVSSIDKDAKEQHNRMELVDLATWKVTDLTGNAQLAKDDVVTDILINEKNGEIWLGTNHNPMGSNCYDQSLHLKEKQPAPPQMSLSPKMLRCDGSFFADNLKRYQVYFSSFAKGNSASTESLDGKGGVIGLFKGSVFLVPSSEKRILVYTPSSIYRWALASALAPELALVSTGGDGLLAIARDGQRLRRFPNKDSTDEIVSISVHGEEAILGGHGVFRIKLADLGKKR